MADLPGWASVVAAGLSLGFAVWSWWRANESGQARDAAVKAAADAEQHLQAVKAQAAAAEKTAAGVGRLVDVAQGPPLAVERLAAGVYSLRNVSGSTVVVEEFVNAAEAWGFDLEAPLELASGAAARFACMEILSHSGPSQLVLRLAGSPDPVIVPIPRAP
ncbi:MAG: hypothetical protein LBK42_11935 [Propionibacteriaceae bacterium]|nr:hypothetical protein [Propionibacteriaceae bacterium]